MNNNLLHLVGFFLFSFSLFGQGNLNQGLVGYFPFDGNANDLSPLAIHGINNNAVLTPGYKNNPDSAYLFNGIDAYIDYSTNNRSIDDSLTISVWVKTTMSNIGWIIGKYDWTIDRGYAIQIENGHPFISGRNGSGLIISTHYQNSTVLVNDGQWHHLLGVIEGNVWKMYVDCVLDTTAFGTAPLPNLTCNEPLSIGRYPLGTGTFGYNYFQGSIDEVRIYNRALIPIEIDSLCQVGFNNSTVAPVPTIDDTVLCQNETFSITIPDAPGTVYWASPADSVIATGNTLTLSPDSTVEIFVFRENKGLYSDTVSFLVTVVNCDDILFPNIITPNGDGINDVLLFKIPETTCFEVEIYNRWGGLIYTMSMPGESWDGTVNNKAMPAGVYFYIVNYCIGGSDPVYKRNTLTIVR